MISRIGLRIRRSMSVDQANKIVLIIRAKIIKMNPKKLVEAVPNPKSIKAVPLIPLVPTDAKAPSRTLGIPI